MGWLASELIVVFAGVSAAFVVENYSDNRNQVNEMHQAVAGIIASLTETERKTREFSDAILADITRWEDADWGGKRAVPGHFRIPGATAPAISSMEYRCCIRSGSDAGAQAAQRSRPLS